MDSVPCAINYADSTLVECGKIIICHSKKEICLSSCNVNVSISMDEALALFSKSNYIENRMFDIDIGMGEIVNCSFSKDSVGKLERMLSIYMTDLTLPILSTNLEIKSVMKSFALQKLAIQCYFELLTSHPRLGDTLKLYSYESAHSGQRRFLVCDEESFVNSYLNTPKKHLYEIIPMNTPCRLYLDLEYNKEFNPELDQGNINRLHPLVTTIIQLIQLKLLELFNITITDNEFIILDSSNTSKFSHHIIVIIPKNAQCILHTNSHSKICSCLKCQPIEGNISKKRKFNDDIINEILFKNNKEVGKFIECIITDMTIPMDILPDHGYSFNRVIRVPKPEYNQFWVNNKLIIANDGVAGVGTENAPLQQSHKSCFIDRGVYTKNRAFRILLSTKHNKTSVMAVYSVPSTTATCAQSKFNSRLILLLYVYVYISLLYIYVK